MSAPRPFFTVTPPAGGTVKSRPEDFEVEEIPAYLPSGTGEHFYLWIEKVGHDTPWVARQLALAASISEREVSYAGLKDRQAVTRQLFCLPAKHASKLEGFLADGVRVLWTKQHGNKLRPGHLQGNRFSLRLRNVRDLAAAEASFDALCASGAPNYFGAQRFGLKGDNAVQGKALLKGERLPKAPTRFERRLFLSAYQSELFNRLLAQRVLEETLGRSLLGDVLCKESSGGMFICEDVAVDQPRVERQEVSPAGPLFGPKLLVAKGEVGEREAAVLRDEGLTLGDFARGRGETEGARRNYRVLIREPHRERAGDDLLLRFILPAGSYATVVLAEIIKDDGSQSIVDGEAPAES